MEWSGHPVFSLIKLFFNVDTYTTNLEGVSEFGLPVWDVCPELFGHGSHCLLQIGQGLVDVQRLDFRLSY